MKILAQDHIRINDNSGTGLFSYSPGICMGINGRIIVTSGTSGIDELMNDYKIKARRYGRWFQGRIYASDDKGKTFVQKGEFPFMHARPFLCGNRLYILGQCNDLMITASDDNGETWTNASALTDGEMWHQAPCNVHYKGDYVYLVMEKRSGMEITGWMVHDFAPVLMRGNINDDLTKRENWTFASELYFHQAIEKDKLEYTGIPFFWTTPSTFVEIAPGRGCAEIGWLETNVIEFYDNTHYLYSENTFHLFMRAHTGGTGYCALAKVVENDDGSMVTMLEKAPSGKKLAYAPMPGGQMKFHIIYDDETKLYWLLSTQSTDSMTRAEYLPEDRYNLPNNERRRLVLHFSKNCFDWCFAGVVAIGDCEKCSRHYAAMAIDGDDLYIVSRSGDEYAKDAHDTNFVSFHKVKGFRDLIY
ncbi:MAG: exo-alpha-sialidase [Clostridia bacterium]|nr:exo-alpha-sialidase [Clostridia bacterium]